MTEDQVGRAGKAGRVRADDDTDNDTAWLDGIDAREPVEEPTT